ncbi:hypothetical protein, partial [Epibacterium ulvae]|uniref:hypothetical protein n=1 Tax=Epibacterium ulvae TaxID=1156985 RepID=UPI0024900977
GKARSHSNGKWPKRALGAAQKRDRSTLLNLIQAEVVTQEFGAQSVVNPLGEAFMSTDGETPMGYLRR